MVLSPSSRDDVPSRCGLGVDTGDRQPRLRLAVTDAAAIALLRLVFEDHDLLAPALRCNGRGDRCAIKVGSADLCVAHAADEQNPVYRNIAAFIGHEFLHHDLVANAYTVLLAARFNDRVALRLRRG